MPDADAGSQEQYWLLRMEHAHTRWRRLYNLKTAADQGIGRYWKRQVQVDRCVFLATARVLELGAILQNLTGRASVPAEVLVFAARWLKEAVRGFPSPAFIKRKTGKEPSEAERAARAAAVEFLAMCNRGEIDLSGFKFSSKSPELYHKKTGAIRPIAYAALLFGVEAGTLRSWKKKEERSRWRKVFRLQMEQLVAEVGQTTASAATILLIERSNLYRMLAEKVRE